ncbi:hypothetical protein BAUCODRAFT_48091, partial [Baudoinia panamericana UAMH 10762]
VPGHWLRDTCACEECRHPETGQRNVNIFRQTIAGVTVASVDASQLPEKVTVYFQDGHKTTLSGRVISNRQSYVARGFREAMVDVEPWTASIAQRPPSADYETLSNDDQSFAQLLRLVRVHGFAFVDNMPSTPEASKALLEQIGPIRHTHYGGFYDFTSDLSSKDTAYTSEALEPHTDNTYFTDPAGLQALHLLSHTGGEGGESVLVDGFNVAKQLFDMNKDAYHVLSATGVYAHASGNKGVSIQPAQAFPTLVHSEEYAKLIQVRWNNADRANVAASWARLDRWYNAAAKFNALINDPKNQYWFQLKPGRMLLFDNWRVLHGRAAFTGERRMCGGYINRDDWISKYR